MTLLEALQDIGKGRIIDNGCEYELIALAKGTYTFKNSWYGDEFEITLTGKQGENARQLEKAFYDYIEAHHRSYNSISQAEYKKGAKRK